MNKAQVLSEFLNELTLSVFYNDQDGYHYIAIKIPTWAYDRALFKHGIRLYIKSTNGNNVLMQKAINHIINVYECGTLLLLNQNTKKFVVKGLNDYILLINIDNIIKSEEKRSVIKTICKEICIDFDKLEKEIKNKK